jgi:hypothetical protein
MRNDCWNCSNSVEVTEPATITEFNACCSASVLRAELAIDGNRKHLYGPAGSAV